MLTLTLTLILALTSTMALLFCAQALHHNRLRLRRLDCIHAHRANRVQRKRMELIELKNRKRLMEETVHGGTTAVEALHRTITGVTFDLVERYSTSEEFKAKAKRARSIHDDKTRTFYRAVRSTNRTLHTLGDMFISGRNGENPRNKGDGGKD